MARKSRPPITNRSALELVAQIAISWDLAFQAATARRYRLFRYHVAKMDAAYRELKARVLAMSPPKDAGK